MMVVRSADPIQNAWLLFFFFSPLNYTTACAAAADAAAAAAPASAVAAVAAATLATAAAPPLQLRAHLRNIKQDDQRILWEGVSSLTKQELQVRHLSALISVSLCTARSSLIILYD
jgi:LETM1-like protein